MIENLYNLNDEDIKKIHIEMAKNFKDDPLFEVVFPNKKKRLAIMTRFLRYYIKAIQPFAHFYSDSKKLNSVMIVFDDRKNNKINYAWRLLCFNLKLVLLLKDIQNLDEAIHALKCYGMFTSSWVKDFENQPYLHLDLIYTKKAKQKKGFSAELMKTLIQYAYDHQLDISVETNNRDNVTYYEHYGFTLMKTISHDDYDVVQYCMMKKWEELNHVEKENSEILVEL
ncbi:MAG: GNAT family N-acetyltransferase [Erysipelotrichaceae bacterium]